MQLVVVGSSRAGRCPQDVRGRAPVRVSTGYISSVRVTAEGVSLPLSPLKRTLLNPWERARGSLLSRDWISWGRDEGREHVEAIRRRVRSPGLPEPPPWRLVKSQ